MKQSKIIHILMLTFLTITLSGCVSIKLNESKTDNEVSKSQDVQKESDLRKISLALEMVYDDDQAYTQSSEMPNKIVSSMGSVYLEEVPTNPDNGNKYYWLDNSSSGTNNDQEYCISTESIEGNYFKCSQDGCKKDTSSCSENSNN